ncbi:basic secretory protein-like protein [Salisaeta longa]|uniref:basic secretory protein-like protein n=1 Tax=Salisaeta longa TaxID=503170 RepID=UPI0003B6D2CC|nr:basic secretory protein-like protein [Salisaeta longa]
MDRSSVRTTLIGLLLVLVAVPAQAQYFGRNKVTYDNFNFRTLRTDHFTFYYYPAEEQAVRDAARMAERWYERHSQVFLHTFDHKPIILYANDADFQQTNVIDQALSPATGGFTEPRRERVVMPLSPAYGETNHVLGHELVHSFQYDLALNSDSLNLQLQRLPLWLVEGMAEYLSLGRAHPHTAMWMRDAALRQALPSFGELSNTQKFFPYRYGQAFLAYVGGKYGDRAVTNLFKLGGQIGVKKAIPRLFGITGDSLVTEWTETIENTYAPLMTGRTPADSLGKTVLTGGSINIAPRLSPDGQYVAFFSARSLFSLTLYVADAQTGEIIAELDNAGTTAHFNALRFISSAGTWSPSGEKLAFVSYANGDNQITIWNVQTEEIERSFKIKNVTALKNPAWSPDGTKLAVTGTNGGISDLYVLNLQTKDVRQLTNDRYADLQPAWSPSGDRIAIATDRGDTNLRLLAPTTNMNLGLVDVSSGEITIREPFGDALHHNPQFSPDGESLYFISDQDGFKDVYRLVLRSDALFRVTRLKTGISGITALSPAMSVARQSGAMMVSVFAKDTYTGHRLTKAQAQGTPMNAAATAGAQGAPDPASVTDAVPEAAPPANRVAEAATVPPEAGVLPPYTPTEDGLVATLLDNPRLGFPNAPDTYETQPYDPDLSLTGIVPPSVGASVGGPLGSRVSGGVALQFSDMLGNQQLTVAVQAQGSFKDIGGQVQYLNQRYQWDYGVSGGHLPVIYGARVVPVASNAGPIYNQIIRRALITQVGGDLIYPLDRTRRFEFGVGGVRYGFDVDVQSQTFTGRALNEDLSLAEINNFLRQNNFQPLPGEAKTRYFAQSSAAYVQDFSYMGLTSPIKGGRMRLQVSSQVGSTSFVSTLADLRRYVFVKPFTFAGHILHIGNYGASFNDLFGTEYIGYPYSRGFIRGYNVREISPSECTTLQQGSVSPAQSLTGCPAIDRLFGTRVAKLSAEVRLPLLGPEQLAVIPFKYLPTQVGVFADAGLAWTSQDAPTLKWDTSTNERVPVTSMGITSRFNVLGAIILEMYYAYPFQRPDSGWEWGLRISPGW